MTPDQRERLRTLIRDKAVVHGEVTLSSGIKANYYVDLRLITLMPEGAYLTALAMLDLVKDLPVDAIGGPTMAADPMAGAIAAVGFQNGKAIVGFMVRKAAKTHGMGRMVEGPIRPGMNVVVIDDTMTTGGSLFQAIEEVEALGCTVVCVATLMDRNQGGADRLAEKGYLYRSAYNINELELQLS